MRRRLLTNNECKRYKVEERYSRKEEEIIFLRDDKRWGGAHHVNNVNSDLQDNEAIQVSGGPHSLLAAGSV